MRNTSFAQKSATLAAAVTLLTGFAVSMASAQTPAPTPTPAPAPAPAAAPTPPPNYKIQYNGLLDGYYQYQFEDPKSAGLAGGNILPGDEEYDVRDNTPTLAEAELNLFKNAKPNAIGFHTTLQAGDTPAIDTYALNGSTRESRYENIAQLYGTYAIGGNGAGIDFGKFYTPYGYEVVDANQNNNYTRSLPFFFLPVYHTGLRAYTPNIKGFTLTGIVSEALFNTPNAGVSEDNGGDLAYIGSINYTDPKGKYTLVTTDGYSDEKYNPDPSAPYSKSKTFLSDNDLTYNISSAVSLGANFEYGTFNLSQHDTNEEGYAVYAKDQFTPKQAISGRFSAENVNYDSFYKSGQATETVVDEQTVLNPVSDATPYEFTLTYEYKPAANFTTRLEYRHDEVNSNNGADIYFADGNGNATKTNQDLVIVAGMFTF